MNLDQVMATFLAESRELLQNMEDGLLRLEQEPDDSDALNAVFRAAHTIKGSAGLFGLDEIVAFTHMVENTLDRVRNGVVAIDADLIALLLACGDQIGALVDHAEGAGAAPLERGLREAGEVLVGRLRRYGAVERGGPAATVPVVATPVAGDDAGAVAGSDHWHISLRFGTNVLRNGLDPLSFLRYLGTLGEVLFVQPVMDSLPPVEAMDPESCYLGFEIAFKSDADKKSIEEVFDFVHDDCLIHILAPHSRIQDYIDLIHDLPEQESFLGEMLVATGALTRKELEEGLRLQESEEAGGKRLGEILVERKAVPAALVEAAAAKQQRVREGKLKESRSIRVQAEKLDRLINLVGELVIAGAGVNLLAQKAGLTNLQEASFEMGRLIEEIRDGALRLRMVEIGETFHRFHRVVRDVGQELGKEIELVITGAETELDKGVVEKINDPLTHLVRNAMDHGIEAAELREERGKPRKGRVTLNAYHESGNIVIEVADDGGGLKRQRIVQRARERGLIEPGQELSDGEIYRLIFEPGFSTAESVTDLSGRGVGMDVVRRNIEALQGSVEVESEEGKGTMVRIRLPLTLAIIDGFLVGVGGASYVVPLDLVRECVELSVKDHESGYLNLRGEVLPLLHLRRHFDVRGDAARRENVVVVQHGTEKAGLVVDELRGEFQTVIKPLARMFQKVKGVGGSTILGSGEVALILDVPAMVQLAERREAQTLSAVRA